MSDSVSDPFLSLAIDRQDLGRRRILGDVRAEIARGERVAILGPSGTGKSTLLQLIAGLLPVTQGFVSIGGQRVERPLPGVTMMLQRPALLPWASVRDNIALGLRLNRAANLPADAVRDRIDGLLARIGLADRGDAKPSELSGGQQQRVALARALAPEPRVLLLDEPFSALDPETRDALRRDVRNLAEERGITLVLVSHDPEDARILCHRVFELHGQPASLSERKSPLPSARFPGLGPAVVAA